MRVKIKKTKSRKNKNPFHTELCVWQRYLISLKAFISVLIFVPGKLPVIAIEPLCLPRIAGNLIFKTDWYSLILHLSGQRKTMAAGFFYLDLPTFCTILSNL